MGTGRKAGATFLEIESGVRIKFERRISFIDASPYCFLKKRVHGGVVWHIY